MEVTITIGWWIIPLLLTAVAIVWAFVAGSDNGGGFMSGIGVFFTLVPALIISLVAWIVYAILK